MNFLKKILNWNDLNKNEKTNNLNLTNEPAKKSILPDYNYNISYFKKKLDNTSDLSIHEMSIFNANGAIITIDGMISKDLITMSIIKLLCLYI